MICVVSACGTFVYALTEERKLLVHTMVDLLQPRPALGVTPAICLPPVAPPATDAAKLNKSDSAAFLSSSKSKRSTSTGLRNTASSNETSAAASLSPQQSSSNNKQESDWTILQ